MRPGVPNLNRGEAFRLFGGGSLSLAVVRLLTHSTSAAVLAAALVVLGFSIADYLLYPEG